jgi:hypothetical protein
MWPGGFAGGPVQGGDAGGFLLEPQSDRVGAFFVMQMQRFAYFMGVL